MRLTIAVEGLDDQAASSCLARRDMRVSAWSLRCADHGPGVPAGYHAERIFDPFFTTKGVGKGLGLGLSISYNIIKDFGGSLTVGPREGGGALFRIELLEAEALNEAAE